MEELQQSNQKLYEVVSQLAESNRNFEQRLYTLERVIEKQKTDFQSQIAKQMQVPVSQTVKPVRQPRGSPSSLQTEEGIENYNLTQYLHGL
ncbi:19124_t:CDS:2, partial [Gigaspora rosea]